MLLTLFDLALHVPDAIDPSGFRYLRVLVFPLIAVGLIALGVYLLRHRHGKKRS
jgi:hypothetical protein